jgi:hypothetical protein
LFITLGIALQEKGVKQNSGSFSLRVKIGENEVELRGTRQEVLETIESIPDLVANINKAFENSKPKTMATITVKTAEETKPAKPSETQIQNYPKIAATENVEHALVKILESDWGKWRPRTEEELKGALQTSELKFSERALASALDGLSRKGMLRRWNTNTGFVYILAEQKTPKSKGEK